MADTGREIAPSLLTRIDELLAEVDAGLDARYPGDDATAQPVHTVYVSAAQATEETPAQWGAHAVELLDSHRDRLGDLGDQDVLDRVRARLASVPIQDLRLDFEDGYRQRADDIEDRDARRAGRTLAALGTDYCGIRIKGLTPAERRRAIRTLELVLDAAGVLPSGFVFTVPKIRAAEQATVAVWLCEELEQVHGLAEGSLRFELQIESPQAILAADGTATVARAIHRSAGRCLGLHYGTYDYSAACGIAPQQQALDHPVADHARAVMLAAAAQTGVRVVDGSTQVLPVGDAEQIQSALRRHHRLVTRSLERGYYQGWDMHPGHLVSRWSATFMFFRTAAVAAVPRLQAYLDRRSGALADEPATAEALARIVLRGLGVGAFTIDDVTGRAPSVDLAALRNLKERTIT
ncbi:HpcH/HpaI aldolase/citrate lyase family protein [Mycobacterium sp. SMC-4]|uniref:HpcH/HpaI aldolase/citrate lyase family protein n=1 Tax=Mycobacterium sp. SMC-4 TaxID=2857059 RepID=UPI0021B3F3EC|nr:HpcH/HpaI aldolase/citrate lyase family protein [Mycobacterium sp. SMC-4]UXA17497.1 aldolase [Mycobacterium sp. SMC-4]